MTEVKEDKIKTKKLRCVRCSSTQIYNTKTHIVCRHCGHREPKVDAEIPIADEIKEPVEPYTLDEGRNEPQ